VIISLLFLPEIKLPFCKDESIETDVRKIKIEAETKQKKREKNKRDSIY
jgi:hypothetical protein